MKQIPFTFFLLVLFACTDTDSPFSADELTVQQQAWDEVMEIHDEVMPKMGEIHQQTKALEEQLETNTDLDEAAKGEISAAIEELEAADEAMWDWMHQLRQLQALRKAESHAAIMTYLEEQKASMSKVKEQMLNSLDKAGNLLARIEQ